MDAKTFTVKELEAIDEEMKKIVIDAHMKAMKAPNPTPESIHDFLWPEAHVSTKYPEGTHTHQGEEVKFIDAMPMNTGIYRDWETDRKSTRLNSSH